MLQTAAGVPPTEPDGDGSFALDLPGRFLGVEVHKRVRVVPGIAKTVAGTLQMPLRWHANPARVAFPAFDGMLVYAASGLFAGTLVLIGRYTGPLGPLSSVGHAVVGARAAEVTATLLLTRLAEQVEATAHSGEAIAAVVSPGLHVGDVMTPDPVVLEEDTLLRTAALVLLHRGISGAPVVDARGELIGVLSERDLLDKEAAAPRLGFGREAAAADRRARARTVGDACTRLPARPRRTAA